MGEKRIVVRNLTHAGGAKIEELQVKNLVYSEILNQAGSISFTLPMYHPKCTQAILDPGARELLVYDESGVLKWGGRLWTAQREGEDEGTNMRFGGEGWLSPLKKRHLRSDKNYPGWDIYDIAWDYINYTQQRTDGNLGITRFSAALRGEVQTLSHFAYQRRIILDLLEEIAGSDEGFDFEITPSKQWKTYTRKGNPVPVQYQLGKDLKINVKNYTYQIDAISGTGLATEFTVAGKGDGAAKIFSDHVDTTARAKYGLLEELEVYQDIEDPLILAQIGALLQRLYKSPREDIVTYVASGDPVHGTYTTGDSAEVRIEDGYTQINRELRLKTIVTTVPNNGEDSVGLFYDEVYV